MGVNYKMKVLKLVFYTYVDKYNHESWNGEILWINRFMDKINYKELHMLFFKPIAVHGCH